MVGVALLPLVAFAVLAALELDTIAKSTANATETAILEHQQTLADSALDSRAAALDSSLGQIDAAVQEALGGALATALEALPVKATFPTPALTPLGSSTFGTISSDGSTLIMPLAGAADGRFAKATAEPAVVAVVAAILKDTGISAVWFQDPKTGAIRAYPAFEVASVLSGTRTHDPDSVTHVYDPVGRADILAGSEGGIPAATAPNVWIQQGAPGRSEDGPFWTDPYPLLEDGSTGVSAWYQDPSSIQVGVDVTAQTLQKLIATALVTVTPAATDPMLVSATGWLLYSAQQASADFPAAVPNSVFTPPQSGLLNSLRHMEATGAMPDTPLTVNIDKASTDIFTAPVYSAHWIVLNPVPVSSMEPNLSALTLGVNDSVHRLFPVTVLPVLILLVGLAFIATTLLSRRMYLPVQALTDHAVLEERTRLAREIHDTLAQQLTGIVLELEAADTLLNRGSEGRARSSVEKARELARGALQEARRSVWNLRPAPLSASGVVAAIGHEVEAWEERTGIPARFRARAVPHHPPLSPTAEVALLRIGQEALSNAARHGKPEHVDVELRAHAHELILSIHDDGIGFDPSASAPRDDCFGLDGMAERARNAGGTLTVASAPGHGTTVTTRLPFTEALTEAVSA